MPTSHPLIKLALLATGQHAAPADAGGNSSSSGTGPGGLPPAFEEHLDVLLALAGRHAPPEELLPALRACVPTYEPFDWSQVGAFPGAERRSA